MQMQTTLVQNPLMWLIQFILGCVFGEPSIKAKTLESYTQQQYCSSMMSDIKFGENVLNKTDQPLSILMEIEQTTEAHDINDIDATVVNIDRSRIPQLSLEQIDVSGQTLSNLADLGVFAYDANEVQRNVIEQVDKALKSNPRNAHERKYQKLLGEIQSLEIELDKNPKLEAVSKKLAAKRKKLLELEQTHEQAQIATSESQGEDPFDAALSAAISTREKLISTGKITPFDKHETELQRVIQKRKRAFEKTRESNKDEQELANHSMESPPGPRPLDKLQQLQVKKKSQKRTRKRRRTDRIDDADEGRYVQRIDEWKHSQQKDESDESEASDEEKDSSSEDEMEEYVDFGSGYRMPASVFDALFEYQRTSVKWMWELHQQGAGGIIGDEMGLGKTIQVICFLAGLEYSELLDGPSIVVCPATVMQQWVQEFHKWWPPFRISLLHDSSSFQGSKKQLIRKAAKGSNNGILITTYEGLRLNHGELLKYNWEYLVLDEGHKIRNPDAEITLVVKKFPTPHRLVLSGAPIQNNLTELWSIFDFVFPGKLGTLPTFQTEFSVPITLGGYVNASPIQVQTAYKCAVALRDLINPYLLRRMKKDVLTNLPSKNEHVLFCKLSAEQRKAYKQFLKSDDVESILYGKRNVLYGIDILRKICNHPDLLERTSVDRPVDYGHWERSGKLKVLEQLLPMWKEQGHKVLLFAQTRQMLDILEAFVVDSQLTYCRLDGNTAIKDRMAIVDSFNNNADPYLFLLSTKVGGLGLNLVGADRVVIFDPDWNPSTDIQARERAWRIGQTKDVLIYRLMTSGTIEEKIYHRQIFKQFLTDKILKDPQQKRFFKSKHLEDLFTLGEEYKETTETEDILDRNFPALKEEVVVASSENNKEEEEAPDDPSGGAKNATMLKKLFDGVTSVVNHDALMQTNEHERVIIESEANKIAQKALETLRLSRIECSYSDISEPTWTGNSGSAGAPTKRFGKKSSPQGSIGTSRTVGAGLSSSLQPPLSSQDIINSYNERRASVAKSSLEAQRESLMSTLFAYICENGGKVSTKDLVEKFKSKIEGADTIVFRSMLKKLCTFDKNSKVWRLQTDL